MCTVKNSHNKIGFYKSLLLTIKILIPSRNTICIHLKKKFKSHVIN